MSIITYIETLMHRIEAGEIEADDAYHNMLLALENSLSDAEFEVLDKLRELSPQPCDG